MPMAEHTLHRALKIAKTQSALATTLGVTQPAINKALNAERVSPMLAIGLEKHFGIPRGESRPDLWDVPAGSSLIETGAA